MVETLPDTFKYLEPVARNLSDSRTEIGRFFQELGDAARIVAPVAGVNSQLFTDMATTFEAFSRDPEALKATISKSPPSLDEGIRSFAVQRPFLRDLAAFSVDLKGATHELRGALPDINPALETGTPVLRRSVALNDRTKEVFGALNELVRAPTTNQALRGLTRTVGIMNPLVRFLGPYQTVCNGWNYLFTYLGEHISETDPTGTAQRAMVNSVADQRNGYGSIGATEPVMGEGYHGDPRGDNAFFHGQGHARRDQRRRHGRLRERPARLHERQPQRLRGVKELPGDPGQRRSSTRTARAARARRTPGGRGSRRARPSAARTRSGRGSRPSRRPGSTPAPT